jgi:IclR family mhp operon transcriptional activator
LTHISRRGGYAVTSKVRSLSSGFQGSPWIVEMLKPWVEDLTKRHLWPFAIATLDRDAMVVQYSSIPSSPLAHVRTTLHKRLSLVSRAHGRAYIAFCGSQERRHLLRLIVASEDPENDVIANAEEWRRLVMQTRKRGYAMRAAGIDPQTSSIAVPVRLESGHVVATLGMTFFRRAVKAGKIAAYAAALKTAAADAAQHVERALRAPVAEHDPEKWEPVSEKTPLKRNDKRRV